MAGVRIGSVLTLALLLLGCDASATPASATKPGSVVGISVPAEQLPPDTRCLIDRGFVLVEVLPPEIEGDDPGYKLKSDLSKTESAAAIEECRKLAPDPPVLSKSDLRVVFDRWVAERDCLSGLGYRPNEPPSFEKFVSSWSTGPWMPIDGIDTSNWTDAQYGDAKERCTLEMFVRDS